MLQLYNICVYYIALVYDYQLDVCHLSYVLLWLDGLFVNVFSVI